MTLFNQATAVILAGGFGTRVRHLLPGVPKPMAPVAGRPFLDWVLRYLARQGLSQVVISTGHLGEVIEGHVANEAVAGLSTCCVRETEPLGTAGGFLHAAHSSGQNPAIWLVMNGDSLALAELAPALDLLNDPLTSGVLIGCVVADASRYGTLAVGPSGELLGFAEKRSGQGLINAGIYLFRHGLLEQFPEERPLSFETEVFPLLIRRGVGLKVLRVEVPFLDIGTPESLRQANDFIEQNRTHFS